MSTWTAPPPYNKGVQHGRDGDAFIKPPHKCAQTRNLWATKGGRKRVVFQMNAVRGTAVTWHPQPWQDGDWGGEEPLSDSDSEEEDFPDDSTTPLGNYVLQGEAASRGRAPPLCPPSRSGLTCRFCPLSRRTEAAPGRSAAV